MLSPYLYCANNPVNLVDRNGNDSWSLDSNGHLLSFVKSEDYDEILVSNNKNETISIWKGESKSIKQLYDLKSKDKTCTIFSAVNDEIGIKVFEFLTENTSVEWSILQTGLTEEDTGNFITSSHQEDAEAGATAYIVDHVFEIDIRNAFHSHPRGAEYPSGLTWDPDNPGDVQFAGWVDKINKKTQAVYKIYNPLNKTYIEYNRESTNADFLQKLKW